MSQNSMSSYLSAQPPELLDHICSCVDSPEDLLSLSLTSKQFCTLAIPNHIEFRRIRCDIRRVSVWKRLADNPTLAAKFTSLEIGLEKNAYDRRTVFPHVVLPKSWIGSHTDDDSELDFDWPDGMGSVGGVGVAAATSWLVSLVTAIRRMSSLTRFRWAVKFLPPSNDVVSALKSSCPGLVEVQIAYTGIGTLEPWSYFAIPSSPLWQYSNLSRFSFSTHDRDINQVTVSAYLSQMVDMLVNRCPRLEYLQLRLDHAQNTDITQLFERGRWPMLKKLSIGGKTTRDSPMILPNSDIMNKFLTNHPMLERVYIRHGGPPLALTDIEHLHAIDVDPEPLDMQRLNPRDIRHFEYLTTVDLSGLDRDRNLHILSHLPSLRALVVKCDILSSSVQEGLIEATPLIEKLEFVGYYGDRNFSTSEILDQHGRFLPLFRFLSRLQHLTHLNWDIQLSAPRDWQPIAGSHCRCLEDSGWASTSLVLGVLAGLSPNLRYMKSVMMEDWGTQISGQAQNIEILRAVDRTYMGWIIDNKPPHSWGEFYIGAMGDLH